MFQSHLRHAVHGMKPAHLVQALRLMQTGRFRIDYMPLRGIFRGAPVSTIFNLRTLTGFCKRGFCILVSGGLGRGGCKGVGEGLGRGLGRGWGKAWGGLGFLCFRKIPFEKPR